MRRFFVSSSHLSPTTTAVGSTVVTLCGNGRRNTSTSTPAAPPPPTNGDSPPPASNGTATAPSTVFAPFPLIDKLIDRQPLAIARAITLVESHNPKHAENISLLLRELRARRTQSMGRTTAEERAKAAAERKPLPPPPDVDGDGGFDSGEATMNSAASASASSSTAAQQETQQQPQSKILPHNQLHSLFALNLEANRKHSIGSMRIAISGSPGSGKSTFIESLGTLLADTYGLRVGVIAVDPSSVISGGSLLGDKTRMEKLSCSPNAFVRPSPSRGHLGGVTARCWETMEIFEAADFDVILVETVGVGQSEIAARNMTDLFLLLVPPASGDELQGIKKGIVEVSDIVVVTKNDGERRELAKATQMAYARAVMFQKNHHNVGGGEAVEIIPPHRGGTGKVDYDALSDTLKPVVCISSEDCELKNQNDISKDNTLRNSMQNNSVALLWNRVERIWLRRRDQGRLSALRKRQCMDHFNDYFNQELIARARSLLGEAFMARLEDEVVGKGISPRQAGDLALAAVLKKAVEEDLPTIPK